MIKLFQFPRIAWDIPSWSPPCLKLETWLRIAGIPYDVPAWPPTVAPPKGKWPYIDDNGSVIADSTFIIDHLKSTTGVDPDQGLTPVERAIGVAFDHMMDDLYWVMVQTRYREPAGWDHYLAAIVHVAAPFVGPEKQKQAEWWEEFRNKEALTQMRGHGMGRHTAEEVHQIGADILNAVADYLGEKPFFFGDNPTGADASIYGAVASIIAVPFDAPSAQAGRQRKNLVDYCERMRQRFFSDIPRV